MDNEFKFRGTALGYNKNDVNGYIDQLTQDYQSKIKEKDDELVRLRNQNKELKSQLEENFKKISDNTGEKAKIAEVMLKAQDTAQNILEEARITALEEKSKIEEAAEQEREKLVDLKSQLKKFKDTVSETLTLFQAEVVNIIKDNDKEE